MSWTAPAISSLRGTDSIPLKLTFSSLTEYLEKMRQEAAVGGVVVFDGGRPDTNFSVGVNINCGGVT
jgi:hypothetical protein